MVTLISVWTDRETFLAIAVDMYNKTVGIFNIWCNQSDTFKPVIIHSMNLCQYFVQ